MTKDITVPTRRGDVLIRGAHILFPLAVHRSVDIEGRWTVTHIPSGYAVHCHFRDFRSARAAVKELLALDWSGIKSQSPLKKDKKAVDALRRPVAEILGRYL